jgi:hypothetical protein
MSARKGRAAAQDAAFTFTGSVSRQATIDAVAFASEVFQPELRVFLATLGRDDVQREPVAIGALRVVGGVV